MPGGHPSDITTIVAHDEDGNPITVADRIVNGLRAGAYFEQCCAAAGIHRETAYGWLRIAGRVRIRHAKGHADLTSHEQACLAFSDAVDEAEAQWELSALATLERLGRGGIEEQVVTVKVNADGSTETSTRSSRTLPVAQVLEWRLERKIPERYGRRVEVTGKDGEPLLGHDERVENITETFRAYLQGVDDGKATEPKPRRVRKPRARKPVTPGS